MQNQGKIAVILSINTLKVKKNHFLVILGHFWRFLANFGHFGHFGPKWGPRGSRGPNLGFWGPQTLWGHILCFFGRKKFFGEKIFLAHFRPKRLRKISGPGPKRLFLVCAGVLWAKLGPPGPFLTLLGPSVGSNVCIKCFLWPQKYLESP